MRLSERAGCIRPFCAMQMAKAAIGRLRAVLA